MPPEAEDRWPTDFGYAESSSRIHGLLRPTVSRRGSAGSWISRLRRRLAVALRSDLNDSSGGGRLSSVSGHSRTKVHDRQDTRGAKDRLRLRALVLQHWRRGPREGGLHEAGGGDGTARGRPGAATPTRTRTVS